MKSFGYAAQSKTSPLAPFHFDRREPNPNDVVLAIDYCGICHSDIHQARAEWGRGLFPMVPGHEIIGHVTAVGSAVTRFKVGDAAAVGVIVESCMHCENCKADLEVYCSDGGAVDTYNAIQRNGERTYGGYANNIVTPQHVVQFTTSEGKVEDAKRLGADEVVISKDADAMAKHSGSFDFILDCVSAPHDMNAYLNLLRLDGTLCLVGLPDQPLSVAPFSLLANRRSLAGSAIGGMKETQEMLDYCAEHNIVSDIELVGFDKVNEAYERVLKNDVKYRFVLDMKTLNE